MTDDVATLQFVTAGIAVLCLVVLALAAQSVGAAYRNGVTDGYGYAKEPNCPGYAHAGEYLRRHMKHRWPELDPARPKGKPIPPQGGSGTAVIRAPYAAPTDIPARPPADPKSRAKPRRTGE